MRFAFISGGEFIIGSPPDELGRTIFEVQHAVYVDKPFYFQMTEVTQQQWKEVMNYNPSYFSGCGDNCPVESVSWLDVQAFIKKLNRLDSNNTYRLPTEAEWEYVCRSGSMTAFSNGALINFDCQENNPLDEMAWYHCNSQGKVHAVAQKMPNDWGIYDMHGNVYEWCQDVYVADYTKKTIMKDRDLDPIADRVGRSCSFNDAAVSCRSAARVNIDPNIRSNTIGFRLVREPVYYQVKMPPSAEKLSIPAEKKDDIETENNYQPAQIEPTKRKMDLHYRSQP